MNHWDSIRLQARERHEAALVITGGDASAEALLFAAEKMTGIERQGLCAGHPLLYKAVAILHADFIWFNKDVDEWQRQFNQAHEYAHYWRHGEGSLCGEADIDAEASEDAITLGAQRVDGYGPHERRELEANVFAREFLLPGDKLRAQYLAGESAEDISAKTGMPVYMVIHQLTRALLGIELVSVDSIPTAETASAPAIELDPSQREAARAGEKEFARGEREPPILVDAGPGTGKTRTLVTRIAHLLTERHISPSQILALTYSNKAAEEMYARVRATAAQDASHVWMGTFHKFGLDLVRKYHRKLGIPPKPTIIDPVDAQLLLEQSLARLDLRHYRSLRRPTAHLRHILSTISRAKDELCSPTEYEEYATKEKASARDDKGRKEAEKKIEVARVYAVYQELLAERGYLDYGDLLMHAVRLLQEQRDVREKLQTQYRHILVDEYQDVNTASRELLKILAGDGGGLWVVGDLRQAIYRFRGAAPINMRLYATEDFPDAKIIQLNTNYRSQRPIVEIFTECARGMRATGGRTTEEWKVNRAENKGEVRFRSSANEVAEAEELVEEVERLRTDGVEYRDQAVLCRRHEDLALIGDALERAGLPVLYLGNFFERPEVRDLLSLIALAAESDGRALFRVANFGEYKFSFTDAQALIGHAFEHKSYFPEALKQTDKVEGVSGEGKRKLGLLAAHFANFNFGTTAWSLLAQYLFVKSDYLRGLVSDGSVQGQQKRLAIYQFLLLAYQLRDRFSDEKDDQKKHFLDYVRRLKLNNEEKQLRQTPAWADDINAVRMLTIHAAKGLEFSAVHLPTLSERKFPMSNFPQRCQPPVGMLSDEMLDWHDEEEECLFFVGLSRARDSLCLYRARQYDRKEADPSSLLRLVRAKLPRVMVKPPVRPALPMKRAEPIVLPRVPREFTERELATYIECPLEYYYRHVLKISNTRPDSPIGQTYLCVHEVWRLIDKEIAAGQELGGEFVAMSIEKLWEEHGPSGHAYEEDYRAEAEAMIYRTLHRRTAADDRIVRPEWKVALESGIVVVKPDYIEFVDGGSSIELMVGHLHLGNAPERGPTDDFYALYDMAATQTYPESRHRIQATYMTSDETMDVHVSYNYRKASLQKYDKAIRGILQGEFAARPNSKRCPYCSSYFICPSVDG